jgi:hypothetical protein
MLPDFSKARFPSLVIITFCVLALQLHPSAAQAQRNEPCGFGLAQDGGRLITAEYSAPCARYYAPYALMAAAAYLPTSQFDTARAQANGSDVELALTALGIPDQTRDPTFDQITKHARTLLRGWRYQFGSEGYIGCLHDNDQAYPEDDDCKKALPGRTRRFFGSFTGPAFHVWARRRAAAAPCQEVSIVFRGTAGATDFLANLRRYTDWAADESYLQLQRNVDAIVGRIAGLHCYRKRTQIVSVGHSLGAGLAQLSAFAQRKGPRIAKVFAFNPSSETGHSLVQPDTLNSNVGVTGDGPGLEIDIVYHPGEVLEQLRELDVQYPLQQRCKPLVRTVRFDVNHQRGLIAQHSIRGTGAFAYGLVETSNEWGRPVSVPPPVSDCPTRYHPITDQRIVAAGPGEPVYVARGSVATMARIDRNGLSRAAARSVLRHREQKLTGFAAPRTGAAYAAPINPEAAMGQVL